MLWAQAPILLSPINGQVIDPDQPVFVFDQLDWEPTGVFDIYLDINPIDPYAPDPLTLVYSGTLTAPPGGRTVLEYHMSALMDEQAYYWFVRYSNGVDHWVSVVQNFLTAVSTQTKYTIAGNIRSQSIQVSVGGVNITCTNSCYPSWCNTSNLTNGYYKFQAYAGASCLVTPTKTGHYFNPLYRQYSNLSQSYLNDNYWIISMNPNKSNLIYPGNGSINVPIMLSYLQWEYFQNPAFSLPDAFIIEIGEAGASELIVSDDVIYTGDGLYEFPLILFIPLEYDTEYQWKVIPYNTEGGDAEGVETWNFVTTGAPLPPAPILWSPVNAAPFVIPENIQLRWSQPEPRPAESFFDVYFDPDPAFPNPPVYHGPGIPDPMDPNLFMHEIPEAPPHANYYWCVKITDIESGLNNTSPPWWFTAPPCIVPGHPDYFEIPPLVIIPPVGVRTSATSRKVYPQNLPISYGWTFGEGHNVPPAPPNINNVPTDRMYMPACKVTDVDGDTGGDKQNGYVDMELDVEPGTWWIQLGYNGVWIPGSPFPYSSSVAGTVTIPTINFDSKGDTEFYLLIAEGSNYDPWLPVQLSSFNAVYTAGYFVELTWVVQSETNLMGYYILRNETEALSDALTLNTGPITAGTALGTQITYTYRDMEIENNSSYYYWLQSIDLDGSTHYFGPVTVTVGGGNPEEPIPIIPIRTELLSAYPNPFNPRTSIPFTLKEQADLKIEIFNSKGQLIWLYSSNDKQPGYYTVHWNGTDLTGQRVSSGVYTCKMTSGKYSAGKKIVLMK